MESFEKRAVIKNIKLTIVTSAATVDNPPTIANIQSCMSNT